MSKLKFTLELDLEHTSFRNGTAALTTTVRREVVARVVHRAIDLFVQQTAKDSLVFINEEGLESGRWAIVKVRERKPKVKKRSENSALDRCVIVGWLGDQDPFTYGGGVVYMRFGDHVAPEIVEVYREKLERDRPRQGLLDMNRDRDGVFDLETWASTIGNEPYEVWAEWWDTDDDPDPDADQNAEEVEVFRVEWVGGDLLGDSSESTFRQACRSCGAVESEVRELLESTDPVEWADALYNTVRTYYGNEDVCGSPSHFTIGELKERWGQES